MPAPAGLTWDSYADASAVVGQAINATGGSERLTKVEDITVKVTGRVHMINQSLTPDGELAVQPVAAQIVSDLQHNRTFRQQESRYPADFVFGFQQVTTPKDGFVIDVTLNNFGPELIPLDPKGVTAARCRDAREVPLLLLRQVTEKPDAVRWLGERSNANGDREQLVSFTQPDGTLVTLGFDTKTHYLSSIEYLQDNGVQGDEVFASAFTEYQMTAGIAMPRKRTDRRNGIVFRELSYETSINTRPADAMFSLPAGYHAPRASEEKPAIELAPGVWKIQANGSLAVLFRDYVFVIEAPNSSRDSEAAIASIQPIRYVTVTHHHEDHAGGIRPFISLGATIVTTPGNRAFFERMAKAEHKIRPDALSHNPRQPIIETFAGKRVFSDGEQTLELYNVGPNSHTTEMIIAYLPKSKILYQGDALILPNSGHDVPKATRLTGEVAAKIRELDLHPETIADVHGRIGTAADYHESLRKAGAEHAF